MRKTQYNDANSLLNEIFLDDITENEKFEVDINKGIVSVELGDFEQAKVILNDEFPESFIENNQNLFLKGLIYKAIAMIRTSELNDAISFLNTILPELIHFKFDYLEALAYNWLGNAYWFKGDLQESLNYHKLAFNIRSSINNVDGIATSLNNMAIIYRVQGKLKKSIEVLNKALNYDLLSIKVKSYVFSNRGVSYYELGDFLKALDDHIISYDLRLTTGARFLISDAIFNIIRTAFSLRDLDLLKKYHDRLDKIPDYPSIKSLKFMSNAYSKMLIDPKSSLDCWEEALNDDSLEFGYKLKCYEEMLNIYSTETFFKKESVLKLLDDFEKMVKENQIYSSLPKIYFVRAIIYKNIFEMEKAQQCLNEMISISREHGLPFHENLAKLELESLDQYLQKFTNIYHNEVQHMPETDTKDIISYIHNFGLLLSDKFET